MEFTSKPEINEIRNLPEKQDIPRPLAIRIGKTAVEGNPALGRVDSTGNSSLESRVSIERFTLFYKNMRRELFFYACKKLNDVYSAEDAVSETMLVVFRRWDELEAWLDESNNNDHLRGYVFGILKNMIFDVSRKQQRKPATGTSRLTYARPAREASPESYIPQWDIERLASRLQPQQEQAIQMMLLGMSYDDMATALNLNPSTVRGRVAVARNNMKIMLEGQEEYAMFLSKPQ